MFLVMFIVKACSRSHFCLIDHISLLLLSHFSRVRLCATPETAAHQAPPSLRILQARTLEWVAISFFNAWKWKVKVKSLSRVRLLATPWTAAYQAPPSIGFSRQEYWSGVPLPSPSHITDSQYTYIFKIIYKMFQFKQVLICIFYKLEYWVDRGMVRYTSSRIQCLFWLSSIKINPDY